MSQYRYCRYTLKKKYCTCSLYIRVNNTEPHFAFIDFCQDVTNNGLNFKYFKHPSDIDKDTYEYPLLDCNATIESPNSYSEWDKVKTSFKYFQCAKLKSSCTKYAVIHFNIILEISKSKL